MPVAIDFHALGIAQNRLAQLFHVTPRSVRRWWNKSRRTPVGATLIFRLLAAGMVTIEQVEAIARTNGGVQLALVRRTNGGVEPAPVEPAPEQSVSAVARAVCALEPGGCRWPEGDPRNSDFRFCCAPVVAGASYCERHANVAYLPALPRGRATPMTWKKPAVRPPQNPKLQWEQEDKDVRGRSAADVSQRHQLDDQNLAAVPCSP